MPGRAAPRRAAPVSDGPEGGPMRRFVALSVVGTVVLGWHMAGPGRARGDVALTLYVATKPDQQSGLYHYDFKLVVDNRTGVWAPGQGYGGLVFGAAPPAPPPRPLAPIPLHPRR